MEHTLRAYDEELNELTAWLSEMGELAGLSIAEAVAAVAKRDGGLADGVVERDVRIDALEAEVERNAIRLLVRRQPMAVDLRRTIAAMKIAGNLERCGDLAKNIAKRSSIIADAPVGALTHSIERMGELTADRLAAVLVAYHGGGLEQAMTVWEKDDEIDAAYNSIFREMLTYMMSDPRMIPWCSHLLFVAKNLERIGDHATNIAELIHYEITGDDLSDRVRPRGA